MYFDISLSFLKKGSIVVLISEREFIIGIGASFVPISKDRTTINENLDIMEMNGSAMVDTEQEKSPKIKHSLSL